MDKKAGNCFHTVYFQLPTAMVKVCSLPLPCTEIFSSTHAENIEDKEGIKFTTGEGIAKLSQMAKLSAENIPLNMQ